MKKEELDKMWGNSDNWKLGIFYYNPKDPRNFIPKKIKWTGFTLNFAKPLSYFLLAIIIVFVYVTFKYF